MREAKMQEAIAVREPTGKNPISNKYVIQMCDVTVTTHSYVICLVVGKRQRGGEGFQAAHHS